MYMYKSKEPAKEYRKRNTKATIKMDIKKYLAIMNQFSLSHIYRVEVSLVAIHAIAICMATNNLTIGNPDIETHKPILTPLFR